MHMSECRRALATLACVVGICCPALAAGDPADTHPDLHLIPWPKSLQQGAGRMSLTAESRIVVGGEELKPLAEVLADEIATLTGLKTQGNDRRRASRATSS